MVAVSRRRGRTLTARGRRGRHVWVQTWDEPTYANSTIGDLIDGDDLRIRQAAVDALGPYNGSIIVVDPNTGRILTMVNQKLALGAGFQPCSTIKLTVALAGLKENLVPQPAILNVAHRSGDGLDVRALRGPTTSISRRWVRNWATTKSPTTRTNSDTAKRPD